MMTSNEKLAAAAKAALMSMGAPEGASPEVAKQYEATAPSEFKISDNMTVLEQRMTDGARKALLAMDAIQEGTDEIEIPPPAPVSPYSGRPYEGFDKVLNLSKRFGGK